MNLFEKNFFVFYYELIREIFLYFGVNTVRI